MKFGLFLCLINAVIFMVYGLFFIFAPAETALYVTDLKPSNPSTLVDMRAMNGGMSIAIGIVLAVMSLNKKTLPSAVFILLIFMMAMALGRLIGLILDGDVNDKMYYYLISEVIIAIICGIWLKIVKDD